MEFPRVGSQGRRKRVIIPTVSVASPSSKGISIRSKLQERSGVELLLLTDEEEPLPASQATSTAESQKSISNQPIQEISSVASNKEKHSPFAQFTLCVPLGQIP